MSPKIITLDLTSGPSETLDLTGFFRMSSVEVVQMSRTPRHCQDLISRSDQPGVIDLSVATRVQIERYTTIETLDLVSSEVLDDRPSRLKKLLPRPEIIDLVPPLQIPYGALDIRSEEVRVSDRPYSDLYTRRLPLPLMARRLHKGARTLYRTHHRRILAGVVLTLTLIVPMVSYIAYGLSRGYSSLASLSGVSGVAEARARIHSARGDFERVHFLFLPFSWIPIDRIDTLDRAIRGGLTLTRGLDRIASILPEDLSGTGLTVRRDAPDPLSYRAPARDILPLESLGIEEPTDWIRTHLDDLRIAQGELLEAGEIYRGVTPTGARTEEMRSVGELITRLLPILGWSLDHQDHLLQMLGDINPIHYIVFNQNRDEIRANGGFPGSVITFTLYKGNILDYRTDDVYYYDWNLYPYREIPPPGIALLTDNYGLRDVNYYPDFGDTLTKANSFIERSGDASITTGIAIHQGIIEDMLARVGPVSVSGVTIPFDEKNFSLLMSTLVENKYARQNTPKDILFQFIEAFGKKVVEKKSYLSILDVLEQYIRDGEILFASRDPDTDEFLSAYRKSLPWETSSQNWIYPLWTSVSGNKSDRYISRSYSAKTQKIDTCKYQNTVTLQMTHHYSAEDTRILQSYFREFRILDPDDQKKMQFIQGNAKNRAHIRLYVPLGARLVGSGSDISSVDKPEATVFSLMMETPVGATSSKSLQYTLDIPACESYTGGIDWWRQPGIRSLEIR